MNLESLIHAQLDGEITLEQHARLEALLREDWQARRLYLELADQHARLLHQPEVNTGRLHQKARSLRWLGRSAAYLGSLTAAAAAVITLGFALWPHEAEVFEDMSNGVAMLSHALDAQFAPGPAPRSGDTLPAGTLKLEKGLAQIEFFSGATALIEGAAEIEIISAWEARFRSGRMRVHVPPAAKGFLLHAPGMKLEDLGTEFALNVKDNASAVHVFQGEVIAHTNREPARLTEGMTLGKSVAGFLPISDLAVQKRQLKDSNFAAWRQWMESQRTDPRLIACYSFQRHTDDRWDRLVPNERAPLVRSRSGGAVGARWTEGRWPGKDALEFKRPGDRVRLIIDGSYNALTFSCWVKVDSVDKKYNALLLTDGYDNGEPHWQIYEDGSLMFSLMYRPAKSPETPQQRGKWNQMYFSKPVFKSDNLGRWHHIAVTYENQSGQVIQYFDGVEVSREVHSLHQPNRPLSFGPCEIGNWGLPTEGHQFPIRNLNGAIDEFNLYSTALNASEIQFIYQNGQPE